MQGRVSSSWRDPRSQSGHLLATSWRMLCDVRADRLIAVLLLLQTRGRVTVAEVARELEVSSRTARRDLEALGVAGVPVYSSAGRGGGWSLVGGARTGPSRATRHQGPGPVLA